MNFRRLAFAAADHLPLPDMVLRTAIATLCARTARELAASPPTATADFAARMGARPIALHTDAANAQHYELPPEFFALCLGPNRKYSSCLHAQGDSLAQAEARALAETCAHADLADGQDILELGCGWGSLSLWMATHYPNARITAVSNSRPQRVYIEAEAAARGLTNLRVITADMNVFDPGAQFDRVVSVEMFEHMSNWRDLLGRIRGWIKPDGRLFLHVFSHHSTPYSFETGDPSDWIAQHFFTGGIMPSHDLVRELADLFTVQADWHWDGTNYAQTARAWLANFDRNRPAINVVLRQVYGAAAPMWARRWRIFFLATEGLFGYRNGREWAVSHYLLAPVGA
jgi:cyclopropane-fatty-acyl-phospholipid synthase